jgi:O-antigen biosynthesis protein
MSGPPDRFARENHPNLPAKHTTMNPGEELRVLRRRLGEAELQVKLRDEMIAALLNSSSWRTTRPLRGLRHLLDATEARLASLFGPRDGHAAWCRRNDPRDAAALEGWHHRLTALPSRPTVSVLMPVYNPHLTFLDKAIKSVRSQVYPDWELCIADDASTDPAVRNLIKAHAAADQRIKTVFRTENGHISHASNSALALATGNFIALLDQDDLLAPHALLCVAEAVQANPEAILIYSDEDKITAKGSRHDPYFKCSFNHELFLAQNMISHLGVYRRDVVSEVGGFRPGLEGSQDWDLALRVIEAAGTRGIIHIPTILYHWRATPGSTAHSSGEKNYAAGAGRDAVLEHLERRGILATVEPAPEAPQFNRVRYTLPSPAPRVSIIIPTRDHLDVLRRCVDSITAKTTYPNYDIVVVDNASTAPASRSFLDSLPREKFTVLLHDGPFNFSALNNYAAARAGGELLCLLNNDTEVLTPSWLEEMAAIALQPDVGAVGARLWYPSGGLQHGGVILGLGGGAADHAHRNLRRGDSGYFGRAVLQQEFSAVTAACLVVRRSLYLEHGGLDEELAVSCNDVDFCLRLARAGFRNIWTPHAELIHHESLSRGRDDTPDKLAIATIEQRFMKARWGALLTNDPCYSPNLSLRGRAFSPARIPRIPPR